MWMAKTNVELKMFYRFNSNMPHEYAFDDVYSKELKGLVESLLFNPEKSTHVNWFELTIRLALDFLFLGVRCLFLPLYNESKLFLKQIKIIINIFSCLRNINLSSFSVTSPCKKKYKIYVTVNHLLPIDIYKELLEYHFRIRYKLCNIKRAYLYDVI